MISVVILTKNNEDTIGPTLESVKHFDEVIVLDSGSKDQTCDIAKTFSNVKTHYAKWSSFGMMRNLGASYASNAWILALDSDEQVSLELNDELSTLPLDDKKVYDISFNNFYNGKLIKCCGWYPESHIRLYNKNKAKFCDSQVHEKLLSDHLLTQKLLNPIFHYSYRTTEDFLKKMQLYSSLFAKQYRKKKRSNLPIALYHGIGAFIKCYLLKKGFLGGKEGFLISWYNANTAFYKYIKLMEANRD